MNRELELMIEAACKAPSGHNSQPWLFRVNENSIDIVPNFTKSLPIVDGNNRELFISLGAATENLCLMAGNLGYKPSMKIDAAKQEIKIDLTKDAELQKDDLVFQIDSRQTNRQMYNDKSISQDSLSLLNNSKLYNHTHRYVINRNDSNFQIIKSFVARGNEIQMNDENFKKELLQYIRFNNKEVKENPTGLTYKVMGAPAMPGFISKPLVKSFLSPKKQNKSDLKKIDSSSNLIIFTTQRDSMEDWINLGRSLERYLLTATKLGIASAFLNQACEIKNLSEEMKTSISFLGDGYPTLILRIGYAPKAPYSPRQKIEDVVLN